MHHCGLLHNGLKSMHTNRSSLRLQFLLKSSSAPRLPVLAVSGVSFDAVWVVPNLVTLLVGMAQLYVAVKLVLLLRLATLSIRHS